MKVRVLTKNYLYDISMCTYKALNQLYLHQTFFLNNNFKV